MTALCTFCVSSLTRLTRPQTVFSISFKLLTQNERVEVVVWSRGEVVWSFTTEIEVSTEMTKEVHVVELGGDRPSRTKSHFYLAWNKKVMINSFSALTQWDLFPAKTILMYHSMHIIVYVHNNTFCKYFSRVLVSAQNSHHITYIRMINKEGSSWVPCRQPHHTQTPLRHILKWKHKQ